jgi:hypothetical protein
MLTVISLSFHMNSKSSIRSLRLTRLPQNIISPPGSSSRSLPQSGHLFIGLRLASFVWCYPGGGSLLRFGTLMEGGSFRLSDTFRVFGSIS